MATRWLSRVLLALLLPTLCGCPLRIENGTPTAARQVTVQRLGEETADIERFSYIGTDDRFHYFKTDRKRYYKVPVTDWQPSNKDEFLYMVDARSLAGPDEPGFELYVKVLGNDIVLAPLP